MCIGDVIVMWSVNHCKIAIIIESKFVDCQYQLAVSLFVKSLLSLVQVGAHQAGETIAADGICDNTILSSHITKTPPLSGTSNALVPISTTV